MSGDGSRKIAIDITKTTVIIGAALLALGYFIGNTLPINENNNMQTGHSLPSSIEQMNPSGKIGTMNLEIPDFVTPSGSDSATVNIVEFGDYQCPFCERFFQQSEPQLMKDYIDSGKAKFYFIGIDFLGPDSLTLAEGSWCADEQGKYYEYHDYTYSHQGEENTGWATPDKVKALAASIDGLDVQRFNSCLDSKKYESRVQHLTSFAQSMGVSGTPAVFVGNSNTGYTQITGAQPYIVFKQVADRYLQ